MSAVAHLDDRWSYSQVFISVVIGDGLLPNDDCTSKRLWHCAGEKKNVLPENLCSTNKVFSLKDRTEKKILHKGLTCDDHGGFSLYVLLLPRTFVEFLLAQRHLVRLDMPTLRVLKEKAQMSTDTHDSLACTAPEAPEAELMSNREARQRCPITQ